jgi:hypothetical protein
VLALALSTGIAALLAPRLARASSDAAAAGIDLRVDVEPVAYVLRGYSVHLRATIPGARRLVAGVGVYGFDLPGQLVDLAEDNRGEPWDVRLVVGYNVFVDGFFGASADHGWEAGLQLGMQHYRARNAEAGSGDARFANLIVLGRVGYEWHPWPRGFYLFPWLGLAYTTTVSGKTTLGDDDYAVAPLVLYGAVELGWRF